MTKREIRVTNPSSTPENPGEIAASDLENTEAVADNPEAQF